MRYANGQTYEQRHAYYVANKHKWVVQQAKPKSRKARAERARRRYVNNAERMNMVQELRRRRYIAAYRLLLEWIGGDREKLNQLLDEEMSHVVRAKTVRGPAR